MLMSKEAREKAKSELYEMTMIFFVSLYRDQFKAMGTPVPEDKIIAGV